ncbi:hypothetical protein FD65_15110, partial [Staphylococcus aureus]
MVAIDAVLGLQLPVATVGINRAALEHLDALRRLLDDDVDEGLALGQVVGQRLGIAVESRKQEAAVALQPHPRQAMLALVEALRVAGTVLVHRREQGALGVEGPAVEAADEVARAAFGIAAK